MESGSGPVLVPPAETHGGSWGKVVQIAALVFAVPAVAWGLFVLYTTLFPSPCGDFSGVADLGVAECWVVDLPVGFLALGAAWFVKRGSPRLRKVCMATSLVTLSLPVLATGALQHFHCR
jgi:hypothetical protein